jgi:hypothetical protein
MIPHSIVNDCVGEVIEVDGVGCSSPRCSPSVLLFIAEVWLLFRLMS